MSLAAASPLLCSLLLLPGAGQDPALAAPEPAVGPWKLDKEYRFVWIRDAQKVGETHFRIRRVRSGDKPLYTLSSRRQYQYESTRQKAKGSLTFRGDGTPVKFEERLEIQTVKNLKGHQDTTITFEDGKAQAKYVQNAREKTPTTHSTEMPPGTYLFASQAVEHWALFASKIPSDAEKHTMKLYYPDFRRIFDVLFEKKGTEEVTVSGGSVKAVRYAFRAPEGSLAGSIWLGARQQLIQIEFPAPGSKVATLKVVLAE